MKRLVISLALAAAAFAPALAQSGKLSVQNATGVTISHIYVSPIDVDRYGPDLLGGQALKAGDSFAFSGLQNGLYDMKVVAQDGQECLLKDVDYFQYSIWTLTPKCGAFGGTGS